MTENRDYVKHLVRCKCILQQYRKLPDPPFHKFIVFSELDDQAMVIPSFAQCPNCGVVHKVKEVGVSEVLRKEDLPTLLKSDELLGSLPEKLQKDLTGYNLELYQLQEINWVFDNKAWGRSVVLQKDTSDGLTAGKYLQIIGDNMWKFGNFTREDTNEAEK